MPCVEFHGHSVMWEVPFQNKAMPPFHGRQSLLYTTITLDHSISSFKFHTMPFFENASNIKIVGGVFNDIKGNYTVFDRSRHETNIDSNNMYNNTVTDSYNDNSKRFSQ